MTSEMIMKYTYLNALALLISACVCIQTLAQDPELPRFDTSEAERMFDISFTTAERDSMQRGLTRNQQAYAELHSYVLENSIPPALVFNPFPPGFLLPPATADRQSDFGIDHEVEVPSNRSDLAFYTVAQLSALIKNGKVSSVELTELSLSRLKEFGDTLECVVTLLETHALTEARRADAEIAAGEYRGPLHGIPYGIKDLFAVDGYKTTWGAAPYKDQVINNDATVVRRLEDAGAVLVAKLTLGALAMGDVWYGGKTRNPWNLEQGSSGSSAGSGSATAAGLVPFAIGTETLGSIVSPSTRNGVTGLRPTFGRVSRAGAMALSWSMDKVGPMCRSAQDCAIVFAALIGPDGIDPSLTNAPFVYQHDLDVKTLRVGYLEQYFDRDYQNRGNDSTALAVFKNAGIELVPVSLPDSIPYGALRIILASEAGAAFDELTRSGKDDLLVRQDPGAWPNYFRTSRFIPAVEYIQANRIRSVLIRKMDELFRGFDAIVAPSFGGPQLLATNLTGHPAISIPNGFQDEGGPTSITIVGKLFGEAAILSLAQFYQSRTEWDDKHPKMFTGGQ